VTLAQITVRPPTTGLKLKVDHTLGGWNHHRLPRQIIGRNGASHDQLAIRFTPQKMPWRRLPQGLEEGAMLFIFQMREQSFQISIRSGMRGPK